MDKATMHADICKALNDLYQRKNADYGDSFGKYYQEYGMTMACIRLEDKLNRLKSLCKQEAKVQDESLEDTLMDLANYAIMTLVEMKFRDTGKLAELLDKQFEEENKKGDHDSACYPNCICAKCVNDEDGCCTEHHGGKIVSACPIAFCPDFDPEGEG